MMLMPLYRDSAEMGSSGIGGSSANRLFGLVCAGPVKFNGGTLIARDIANLWAGLDASGASIVDPGMRTRRCCAKWRLAVSPGRCLRSWGTDVVATICQNAENKVRFGRQNV